MELKQVESLWVFGLASEYCGGALSSSSLVFLVLFLCGALFVKALLHWASPGGPAWGKHYAEARTRADRIIPGPRGLPFVGSMKLMAYLAHRRLAAAAERHGAKRLMAFSLCETRVIVTCDPDVAKEILGSSVFADRPSQESARGLMFDRAIGFAPYSVYWRALRRICAAHFFSPKQTRVAEPQRFEIASQIVSFLSRRRQEQRREGFAVRDVLKRASLNSMMWSVFGRKYDLADSSNQETEELSRLVDEGYELLGVLNWSDHLQWLSTFDPQRVRSRCSKLVARVNRFVNRILMEHKRSAEDGRTSHDFVDLLLSLHGPDKLSDEDMVAVLWEMIFRGTDVVAVVIEWVLARMVLHPDIQSTVQDELDRVVGRSRPVMESDVASMVYLPAVVKEVLRLHPPGPLLSWARMAISDTTVDGFDVPAGTTAMVNMWAITRDPRVWEDPMKFMPERFLGAGDAGAEFSVLGSDLRLAPFGSGRRVCPGKSLGLTTVNFWVATLLHEFEWAPPSAHNPVDLSEVLRLSCEMATPLIAKVHPRRA